MTFGLNTQRPDTPAGATDSSPRLLCAHVTAILLIVAAKVSNVDLRRLDAHTDALYVTESSP